MTTVAKYHPDEVRDLIVFYVDEFGREPDAMELSWHGAAPVEVVAMDAEPGIALSAAAEGGKWVTRPWA